MNHKGFSLIELLVAITTGLLVTGTAVALMGNVIGTSTVNIGMVRMNDEIRTTMDVVSREVRRVGFDGNSLDKFGEACSFQEPMANLVVNASCIQFAYDRDQNGSINTGTDITEQGVFRLTQPAGQPGRVEFQYGQNVACNSPSGWQDLTNPNLVDITTLTFNNQSNLVAVPGSPAGINLQQLQISITGEMTTSGGDTYTRSLNESIRIRNDAVVVTGAAACT